MSKPTLFIGSSSESLPVVEALTSGLSAYADVTPWSQKEFFRSGLYYLDNIIAKIPLFDFAVFIFGPDDSVKSRGKKQTMPRDNVIFEFGYAMAKLDRKRVFHLVPKGPKLNIKVMSDLAGMKPWEYQLTVDAQAKLSGLASKWATVPEADKQGVRDLLKSAMEDPCRLIGETVSALGPLTPFERAVAEGPRYVSDVYQDILSELSDTGPNEVLNLALDMEQAWPALRDRFVFNARCPAVQWHSLVIDPRSPTLQQLDGPSFSTSIAAAMIDNLTHVCQEVLARHLQSQVSVQCRAYDSPPTVHGFLVNGRVAYVSLCGLSSNWSSGTSSPYLRFQKGRGIPAADHMVESFGTVFAYHWNRARPIWPPEAGNTP